MPKKRSFLTGTDKFCGCGGSSSGAEEAGLEIQLALNHWPLAVETHNTNFPNAKHDCVDISASDPRRYFSTDFLLASPECTNQTNANGKKKPKIQMEMFISLNNDPGAERSRATMWDVPRFTEYHMYNFIIVENVVEARKWIMWEAWLKAMQLLGYYHKCCYLNSMHFHPCPQSRDRMYVVFWKKGNKAPQLNYTPLAYCPKCQKDVNAVQSWKRDQKTYKYKTGYVYCCPNDTTIIEPYYYAAFNCIDWSIKGERIGDKKKPLVENTMRRINLGREEYWGKENELFTNTPFIIKGEYAGAADESYVRNVIESLLTQSTRQTFGIVTPPIVIENKGQSTYGRIQDAISTITTTTSHGILTTENINSFISYYNGGSDVSSHITAAAGTFVGTDRHALVTHIKPDIEDCYYRTLKAHEVKIGMAFKKTFKVLGTSKEQVKQCGNAVTPPVMKWLVSQGIKTLL